MGQKVDHYSRRAKREGYAARSIYKLEELDKKYHLLKPAYRVLNLGAAPGSWVQYISQKIGREGIQIAIDIEKMTIQKPGNLIFIKRSIFDIEDKELKKYVEHYDLVVSDMAPKTTGNRSGDHARSIELCEKARDVSLKLLTRGGSFACKMYQGGDTKAFAESLRSGFERVVIQKPRASKSESREIFIVALGCL